jgi:energy-coupling factor transport system ATP-binding protein
VDNAPALEVEELSVHFGETAALQDVSLGVNPGEYLLLTGPSGSGKSTLMRCLNGLIPHVVAGRMSGRVLVHGLDTREHEVAKLAETVGFVFQNPETQLFNLTVHDEVMFAPTNLGYSPSEAEDLGRRALRATGASHLEMRRLATLSGGEKQRVAIASVLALRPSILVLDEPTAHLDVSGSDAVLGSLTRLCKEEGVTVVLGEHRTGAAGRVADRMAVLEQGRLMAEGPTRHVFARRDLMRRLGIRRPADEPENPWETLIERPDPPAGIPPVAELRGVHAGYGKHEVLHGLDLAIYPGEILALVGDNGAGKTTVARLLSGLMSPQKGQVLIRGRKPRVDGGEVGLVVQNPMTQLFCETVEEEVSFGPTNLGRRDRGDTERAMDVCDLRDLANRPVHALSCGQQQRTVVASVLALGTGLLILDEPTMGQDWGHLTTMMSHLRRLTRAGCSIVLVTHDYKLVHHYADRVVLLRDGRVGAMGRLHRARSAVTMCAGIR